MYRQVTQSLVTSSQAVIYPAVAVDLEFSSGNVRLWSGNFTQSYGGNSFLGIGSLGGMNTIKEASMTADGLEMSISGIPSEYVFLALDEAYRGKTAIVYLWLFDSNIVMKQSIITFKGMLDTMTIEDSGTTATIKIRCENRLIEMQKPRNIRYTNEDQLSLYPDDVGLSYVASVALKEISWGSAVPAQNVVGGGGGNIDPEYNEP
jgi:hypothetical protein